MPLILPSFLTTRSNSGPIMAQPFVHPLPSRRLALTYDDAGLVLHPAPADGRTAEGRGTRILWGRDAKVERVEQGWQASESSIVVNGVVGLLQLFQSQL
jgi:hypothetical protein